jgi:hypothetical protein
MKIEPNISHAFKIDPIRFQIWKLQLFHFLLLAALLLVLKKVAAPISKDTQKSGHPYLKRIPKMPKKWPPYLKRIPKMPKKWLPLSQKDTKKAAAPLLKQIFKKWPTSVLHSLSSKLVLPLLMTNGILDYMGWSFGPVFVIADPFLFIASLPGRPTPCCRRLGPFSRWQRKWEW